MTFSIFKQKKSKLVACHDIEVLQQLESSMHWKVLGLPPIEFWSTLHEIELCDEISRMYYVNGSTL